MIGYVSVGLLGLLALSIPVGIVLFLLGFGIDAFFSSFPLTRGLGNMVWSSSNSATLIAIPFFVLLGEILVRSGVATRTYAALDRWVSWLPGGLVHANVATATMFWPPQDHRSQPQPLLQPSRCPRLRSWAMTPSCSQEPSLQEAPWAS